MALHRLIVLLLLSVVFVSGCSVTGSDKRAEISGGELRDHDGDGIVDRRDLCPLTRQGVAVDSLGCMVDTDRDQVPDGFDRCPLSQPGAWVDSQGCDQDRDRDHVVDGDDACLQTPAGAMVDSKGCALSLTLPASQDA